MYNSSDRFVFVWGGRFFPESLVVFIGICSAQPQGGSLVQVFHWDVFDHSHFQARLIV